MKKRIISFLLVMALLLSMAPMVTIEAEATEIIYEASEVVDIALEYANKAATGWSGYCLSFVRQCFKDAYGFNSSDCCAYQYGSKYIDSTSRDNIPLGADVFFGGSDVTCNCGTKAGHIGMYVGDGYIVHSWGSTIKKTTIDHVIACGYPYRGYGWHGDVALVEGYLSECTEYPCGMELEIIEDCSPYTLPCNSSTAAEFGYTSTKLDDKKLYAGIDTVTATALYKNSEDNYWYKVTLSDGTNAYLFSEHTLSGALTQPWIEGGSFPSQITGATLLEGTMKSYGVIETIQAQVCKGNTVWGNPVIESDIVSVDGTSYSLKRSDVDYSLPFQDLADHGEGYYTLTYDVSFYSYCADGNQLSTTGLCTKVGDYYFCFGDSADDDDSEDGMYTISFDARGGEGAPESITADAGTAVTLPEQIPTCFKSNFGGWYDAQTGITYQPGDTLTITANMALEAQWSGLCINLSGTYTWNESCDLPYAGYGYYVQLYPTESATFRFSGTSDNDTCAILYDSEGNVLAQNDDCDGTFQFGITYTLEAEKTYYLYVYFYGDQVGTLDYCMAPVRTLTYVYADGSTESIQYAYGEYVSITSAIPYNLGYNFQGWYDSTYGVYYYPGDSVSMYEDLYLESTWGYQWLYGQHSCPINYAGNGYFLSLTVGADGWRKIWGVDECDTKAVLYDAYGNVLTSDDDSYGDYQFLIEYYFTAYETYYVYVSYYDQSLVGDLEVMIAEVCGPNGHGETYWETIEEVEATCTEDGYCIEVEYCYDCGAEVSRDTTIYEAEGHYNTYWETIEEIHATCTEDGYCIEFEYCYDCGEVVSTEEYYEPAYGHSPDDAVIENEIAGTCTQASSYDVVVYCWECGEEISRETIMTPGPGHTWFSDETAPTCTEQGYTTYTCAYCGYVYVSDYVAALDHNWDAGVVTTQPTTEHAGVKTYTCRSCGETKTEVIPPLVPETDTKVTISNVTGKAGDTVEVYFTLTEAPELRSIGLSISYDTSALTLVSGQWLAENALLTDWNNNTLMGAAAWVQNTDLNGEIFKLTFRINDDAEAGEYAIGCTVTAKTKPAGGVETVVPVATVNGYVTVRDYLLGDMTDDGYVDADDAIYLLYFTLFGEAMYPVNQDADFNNDGFVDADDAIYLLYHTLFGDSMYPLN